ncbi:Radical SAM superfamily protein [Pseudobutyrivibrio sp. YE44]|uniref:radical SAM protein n=1 Tax=Pseudobutyrivibrio sp. YE44 TaxID=1520802 RepID=UPI0008810AF2|nr:radical SAM protein [Pseudobutyrivibrio sp. YE44]SDB14731.1 Radical SAM superfamily protein [Pseudobutyrivibrio sp. YE44]
MAETKLDQELLAEIRLKNELQVDGLNFDPEIFKDLELGTKYKEQVNVLFSSDRHAHVAYNFPVCLITPKGGYQVRVVWDKSSDYTLKYEDGRYFIEHKNQIVLDNVQFAKRANYYNLKTSDGTDMRTVAVDYGYGHMFVSYSNECFLKDKGLDCLFCNINATKALYGERDKVSWKTPQQIAETIAAGYKEGFNKMTVSGGFIPERREVEYYIDVAEAIQEATGLDDFNGTACVGATKDFSVFENYKEAGFRTIASNIEIWNPKIFDVICPGKTEYCGGRDNWLKALEYEVDVFGKFNVRSTMVSGIEPKQYTIEGLEYLVEHGVVALPSQWNPNCGSALEGHRTPNAEWHWDVFEKAVAIYRKNGLTWQQFADATAGSDSVAHDLFRLYEGIPTSEVITPSPVITSPKTLIADAS